MSDNTNKPAGDGRTIQLRGVRLSFTDALKDKQKSVDDAEPKHGCNIILETDGPYKRHFEANRQAIVKALEAAGEVAWGKKDAYVSIAEDNPKRVCFRRGERFKNQDGEVYAGYAGNWGISAAGPGGGRRRPKLYDRHKRDVQYDDILDVCYGGSYADVIISFYGTDKGSRGIFASIEGIRSYQEGERMGGGGVNVTGDMFDELPDEGDAFAGTSSAGGAGGGDFGIG